MMPILAAFVMDKNLTTPYPGGIRHYNPKILRKMENFISLPLETKSPLSRPFLTKRNYIRFSANLFKIPYLYCNWSILQN